ncbi:MAG: hypothetical protein KDK61_06970 [Simkania sp.]|uniref:PsbP C-terminal domain-containing protein n=1 Tax=Simkania negevensis (strain ATCC VR-1471 / DSM 27360 / Z) TaxID=331113 RepID=F8L895_SIMNZ|nr:hypothetical protein [Simkania negevensis]MCB1084036.1 hypothetical protein [Simkania sp.]CCB89018.1 putative uncharacterized protein [Simkania negevensis Z]
MFKLWNKSVKGRALAAIGSLALLCSSAGSSFSGAKAYLAVKTGQSQVTTVQGWKKFHSIPGACSISLPSSPEHVKQIMPLSEEGHNLRYDVYVAAHEKKAVYMLLVAQYPPFVNQAHADMSLESFLNGLITQNPENKLIFADLTEVQGYKALDFFIEAKGNYFKGRAVMADNNLYLLAMECDGKNYHEDHFSHFISSFELKK